MKVIIIGGGIGGLSAALALRRVGIQSDVYERARDPRTTAITKDSWRYGNVSQWENPFGNWLRNRLTCWTPNAFSLRLMENRVSYEFPQLLHSSGSGR